MPSDTLKLLLLFGLSTISVAGAQENSESNLFFDFKRRQSNGWTGLQDWKWPSAQDKSATELKGIPLTSGLPGSIYDPDPDQVIMLNTEPGQYSALASPLLPEKKDKGFSCLYFNYYVRVPNTEFNGIRVSSVSKSGYRRKLWGMSHDDMDIWEVAEVEIDRSEPTRIQFEVNNTDGIIALSGFFLREGSCPDLHSLDCSFESEKLCQWFTNDNIHQTRNTQQTIFKAKPEDHTTDTLFGSSALFVGSNNQGHMISPITSSFHKCLRFAYMRNAKGIDVQVEARIVNGPNGSSTQGWRRIWGAAKEYPLNEWNHIQIPIDIKASTQFMLNITNFNLDRTNALQIDDLQLMPYCLENTFCPFNSGFCEWRSDKNDQARWRIGIGRVVKPDLKHPMHPTEAGIYTDFTETNGRSSMRIRSPYLEDFNFDKCVHLTFQVDAFQKGDSFVLDSIDQNGVRKTVWSFNTDDYDTGYKYHDENIPVRGMFVGYRFELVAESENPLTKVVVMRFNTENSPNDKCVPLKYHSPRTPTPTPAIGTTAEPKKTKLSPAVLALVNALLRNVRSQVDNILNTIEDKNDLLYDLVNDVDAGLGKAIKAASM